MTGYELAQFFDQSAAWVWSAPHSNIYPELHRLQKEGFLVSSTEVRGEKLERRIYEITDAGLEELRKWAASDPTPSYARDPLFVRVGFLDLANPADARIMLTAFVEQQRDLVQRWEQHVIELREREAPLLRERLKHRPDYLHETVAEFKVNAFLGLIGVAQVRIDCAERSLDLLRSLEEP